MTHDPELVTYGPETVGNGNGEAAAPSLIFTQKYETYILDQVCTTLD